MPVRRRGVRGVADRALHVGQRRVGGRVLVEHDAERRGAVLSSLSVPGATWPTPCALPSAGGVRRELVLGERLAVGGVQEHGRRVGRAGGQALLEGAQGDRRLDVLGGAGVAEVEVGVEAEGEDRQHARARSPEARAYAPGAAAQRVAERGEAGALRARPATTSTARRPSCRSATRRPAPASGRRPRVTATAIARAGPIDLKMPSELSTSAMNATMTAPPADAIASPARVDRLRRPRSCCPRRCAAVLGSGTGRTGCSRCRSRTAPRSGSPGSSCRS